MFKNWQRIVILLINSLKNQSVEELWWLGCFVCFTGSIIPIQNSLYCVRTLRRIIICLIMEAAIISQSLCSQGLLQKITCLFLTLKNHIQLYGGVRWKILYICCFILFQNLFLCFLGLRIRLLLIPFKHTPKQSYLKGVVAFSPLICCDLCCRADYGQQNKHSAVRESSPRLLVSIA